MNRYNQEGFTLTELMLAMVLFSTVLVISTVGFIGMNRTFNRGVIRKGLSEGVRAASEDIGRALRSQAVNSAPCRSEVECEVDGWKTLAFGSVCYMWQTGDQAEGGLYKVNGDCRDEGASKEELLHKRYRVRELDVGMTQTKWYGENYLYVVSGVFTTLQDDAIHMPDPNDDDQSGHQWRCKGTAEHPDVASCAVEQFRIIINPRGGSI